MVAAGHVTAREKFLSLRRRGERRFSSGHESKGNVSDLAHFHADWKNRKLTRI